MLVNFRPILRICLSRGISPSCNFQKVFSVPISTSSSSFRIFKSPLKFTKRSKTLKENVENEPLSIERPAKQEGDLDDLLDRTFLRPGSGHQVLIIQPYIKWGPKTKRNTTPQLQLLESVTLIKTLRQWKVVKKMIVSLKSFHKQNFFGSGNLRILQNKIKNTAEVSAVFISANTLTLRQQFNLEEAFGVPVFDRYTIIIHIFKEHAHTRETKLQVQLAQLPYLWKVMGGFNKGYEKKLGVDGSYMGGSGPKFLNDRREMFKIREAKLKKEILQLREEREMLRKRREKSNIPVVAVIGYTNSGKTSLIKILTAKKTLEPQDYLFATLDVTSHLGVLPNGIKAYFVDTLGFISDIPTYLIESFVSTLEDATSAHLIIHVRDVSHPDTIAQNDNVLNTLNKLKVPEETMDNIITIGNKIDLLDTEELKNYQDLILVSCKNLTGIDVLRQEVEAKLMLLSDNVPLTVKVKSGGVEYEWLHEMSTVVSEVPDPNNSQYMLVQVVISSGNLAKFKHDFIKNYKKS